MLPPPQFVIEALGYGVVVPAAVTAVGLSLARVAGWSARGGDLAAVSLGLFAGLAALGASRQAGWEFLSPDDAWEWLPALALLAAVVGVIERFHAVPGAIGWALRAGVAALTAWLLVRGERD